MFHWIAARIAAVVYRNRLNSSVRFSALDRSLWLATGSTSPGSDDTSGNGFPGRYLT